MKKIVLLFLCFVMLFSLVACSLPYFNETNKSTENSENEEVDELFKIEVLDTLGVKYYIYDIHGNLVLSEETSKPINISMISEYTVEIRIGMGTGTSVTKYYNAKTNRFSREFEQVVAASGELVAYLCPVTPENNSADIVASAVDQSLVVQNIFDKNVFYKVYNLDFYPTVMPVESASFTEDNTHLEISYISGYSQAEALHASLPIKAGFYDYESVISLYREAVEATYRNWDSELVYFPDPIGLVDPREREDAVNLLEGVFSFFPRRTQAGNTPYNKYHCTA